VAVATGSDDAGLKAQARELGAEIVLGKSINLTALLEWLNRTVEVHTCPHVNGLSNRDGGRRSDASRMSRNRGLSVSGL